MPFTVTVKDGSKDVHVFQVGQTVAWPGRAGKPGVVTKVVVTAGGPANTVRWPGGILSTHWPRELLPAYDDGSR